MTRRFIAKLTFIALLAFSPAIVSAQNQGSTRGNLGGTVYDSTKAVVQGATVTATGPLGKVTQTTNAQGTFMFTGLVPGEYSVLVEKEGFKKTTVSPVNVLINNTQTLNVTVETGSVETVVEVSGAAAAIDTTSSSINANLDDTFYNAIPVGRNVSSVMMIAPGVVSGLGTSGFVSGGSGSDANPSISGASGLENLYVADGVVLNDPSFGGLGGFSPVYGALGVGITPAFVKEVEVKTAGFEPQYGHATGGVVQIVTKSGGTKFHGTIGGYFQPKSWQEPFLTKDNFNPTNYVGTHPANADYEADLELGGYIPGLRNHLFFFGAYNPTFFHDYVHPANNPSAPSGLYLAAPNIDRRTNTYSYAAKITAVMGSHLTFESSIFGDPAHTNHVPWYNLAASNTTGYSKWDFGTRNWANRINAVLSPTWTADVAYTYAWNHFTETPAINNAFPIEDQTQIDGLPGQLGDYQMLGIPFIENYRSNTQSINFDTSKTFRAAGSHTVSLGYLWQNPHYNAVTTYSGPTYAIPGTNATGGDPGTGSAVGAISDASLQLQVADPTCTLCPTMNIPGLGPSPVWLYQVRGRFDGGISPTYGKYHAAYGNDAWQMGDHVTVNLGLRWEQQLLAGKSGKAFFNDQWSPRIGLIVDPTGDRKSKIYTQFSRLAYVLPLDMAVRELGGEDDNTNEYWAPVSDSSNNVVFDQYGAPQFMPDAAHLLNNATGGFPSPVSISIQSGGEPFTPGIRMEYNDEFVVGAEHKFNGGFTASVRYIDRRMKRVVEDEVGASVEQLTALAFNGGSYSYVLGNPSASQAIYVTPDEQTFSLGAKWNGQAQLAAAQASPSATNTANLIATGYPAACIDSANNPTPFNAPNRRSSLDKVAGTYVGSACFPAVNGVLNTDPTALFGGEYFPTGCKYCHPGLYPNPQRNYQAVEFEVNKTFSNNWLMRANLRVGRLLGNYEGAFRNDNGQSDPGISSLFDLTDGSLGLLGHQLGIGPLNSDRKYVLNIFPSYTIPSGFAKNLVLGTGIQVASGLPITTLAAQQIYGNPGEVPINGRGDLGRSPVTGSVSAHLEYPIKFSESKQLSFSFDAFNIANSRRFITTTQFVDLSFGVVNQDFNNHVPLTFTNPFSARMGVAFTF